MADRSKWITSVLFAALLFALPQRASAQECEPGGGYIECEDLWRQCEMCPQGINGECDGICNEASACSIGYYVLDQWRVRVGHRCNGQNPTRQLCKASTLYHNYYEFFVRIENQYWEQRMCRWGGNSFSVKVASVWESARYCWIHDGYCFGSFGSGSMNSCRFDRLASPSICN